MIRDVILFTNSQRPLKIIMSIRKILESSINRTQFEVDRTSLRVRCAECLLSNGSRAKQEWLCLGILALVLVQRGELQKAGSDVRVFVPVNPFRHVNCFLSQRNCF